MTGLSSVFCNIKNYKVSHGQVAQLVGALSHTPKWCGFNPWSGHTHMLCVGLIPGRCVYKRKPINVSFSHQCFSLFLSLSSSLSKVNKNISLGKDFFKKARRITRLLMSVMLSDVSPGSELVEQCMPILWVRERDIGGLGPLPPASGFPVFLLESHASPC